MIALNSILDFSHTYCVAICAFLVPLNLIATGLTLLFAYFGHSQKIAVAASLATLPAILMVLHVFSWLVIGVVMPPTYILLGLGSVCLAINCLAIFASTRLEQVLGSVRFAIQQYRA